MSVKDSYITIDKSSFGEYKEKGSKFLAYSYPFDEEKLLDDIMVELHHIHPKARHYCFAYKIGLDSNRFRTNDDGEPSGTAGKPIFGQINSFQLTNVLIVVIRYFGGTKLGASGLIHAYKEAAKDALENAHFIEKYLTNQYLFVFEYDQMGHVLNVLKELDVEITSKSFEASCEIIIQLRLSAELSMLLKIKAKLLHKSLDEVNETTIIPFCSIKLLV